MSLRSRPALASRRVIGSSLHMAIMLGLSPLHTTEWPVPPTRQSNVVHALAQVKVNLLREHWPYRHQVVRPCSQMHGQESRALYPWRTISLEALLVSYRRTTGCFVIARLSGLYTNLPAPGTSRTLPGTMRAGSARQDRLRSSMIKTVELIEASLAAPSSAMERRLLEAWMR